MSFPIVLTLFSLQLGQPRQVPDRWFGEDKFRHFVASFVITSVTTSGARAAGIDHRQSQFVGAGVGVAAGLYKEARDSRAGLPFSGRDLVWDAAGIGAAVLLLDRAH